MSILLIKRKWTLKSRRLGATSTKHQMVETMFCKYCILKKGQGTKFPKLWLIQ